MAAATQWFYQKEGMLEDSAVGPISEDEVAALIRSNKIKPNTLLASPTVTKGQWVRLSDIDFTMPLSRHDARVQQQREKDEKARQATEAARQLEIASTAAQRRQREVEELAARENQQAAFNRARVEYLESIRDLRRRYRVVVTDVHQAEHACNAMGVEGWQLDAAFAETFTYPQCGGCCQPEIRRQFVFVFSQPLSVIPQ